MRYSGKIGYAVQTETSPGVWEDTITERAKLGTVKQRTEALDSGSSVLPEYRTTTSVSVLCDGVLKENYDNLRYLSHLGKNWVIASAVMEWPELILYIGEVYNGPLPIPEEEP